MKTCTYTHRLHSELKANHKGKRSNTELIHSVRRRTWTEERARVMFNSWWYTTFRQYYTVYILHRNNTGWLWRYLIRRSNINASNARKIFTVASLITSQHKKPPLKRIPPYSGTKTHESMNTSRYKVQVSDKTDSTTTDVLYSRAQTLQNDSLTVIWIRRY